MTTIYRVDSRDRDIGSQSTSDFTVNCIPTHCVTARLKHVIMPNVFNNVRSTPAGDNNSTFSYESNGVAASFTLADGYYSITDLIATLDAALAGLVITFVLDTVTDKITVTNGGGVSFTVLNIASGNTMADLLGITTDVVVAAAGTATFGNKINMVSYSMVYVISRKLSNGHNLTSADVRWPIIATVPIDTPHGTNLHYEPNVQHTVHFSANTNIEECDIRITNHAGETLSIGSNNHIQVLYEFDTTTVH
jgi:hypothetical protein